MLDLLQGILLGGNRLRLKWFIRRRWKRGLEAVTQTIEKGSGSYEKTLEAVSRSLGDH